MDPNEALKTIRDKVDFIIKQTDMEQPAACPRAAAAALAEAFLSLDIWLCAKGFLPKSWER